MEINIIRDINDEITCNKIKFRLIAGAKNRRIVVLFVAGLFISFLDYNSINLAIGMIFIGASLMLYYETHLLGMTSITNNKKKISEYKGNNRTIEININDSFLSHETMKSYIRMDWKAIVYYKRYKDYLFILPSGNYSSSFVIKKSELSENDYMILYNFLKENFREKK